MKLRYETGIAAMTQFLVIVLLNFVGAIVASIGDCRDSATTYDCVSGIGINVLYVILLAVWFGFVWVLAYAAQDRRDHRLAKILIGAEFMILLVSLFNAKHYPNILGLITSLVDAAFAVWIIWLAFRLTSAKGGRITTAVAGRKPRTGSTSTKKPRA
jgi:hypothetical protein